MARQVTETRWASERAVYRIAGASVLGCMKGSGLWIELCGLEMWATDLCRSLVVECFEN